ncbi:MAG: helix-turn-helix transcriptional regulator [Pseudonocardiales bacterium]|nr:helix-turn-helix transcriptional regulator [Pseudonocardiales bacterium]
MDADEVRAIGARARMIRDRRGLSLDVVGGLAGISGPYLSMLERGLRGFNRRGLLDNLAEALGCSVADLTGQHSAGHDRRSALVAAAVAAISTALHDTTLDDVPDVPVRPLPELTKAVALAHEAVDDCNYGFAGQGLPALLVELHVHVVTSGAEARQVALVALATACRVASAVAGSTGQMELAGIAAQRGRDAAWLAERPDLVALAEMNYSTALLAVGARRRGLLVCAQALRAVSALPGPTRDGTATAEVCGMLHLTTALIAARDGRTAEVATHLGEARSLAAHTGERNHMRYHFGPTNVAAWEITFAVEAGAGPEMAERLAAAPIDLSVFDSKDRAHYVYFDLARAWAQADGARDDQALRALDTAARLSPVRIRHDPIARDLLLTLDQRARRRTWELDSLRRRFGIGGPG